ncbi:hypothetical protein [Lentzea sp. NPDC059081]|uniref:hypothetical protein n=1 Tax=Lentzea sp. NPDC059081 TaxID=3346719 RepID=UPI00368609C8
MAVEVTAMVETFVEVDPDLEAHLSELVYRKWMIYYFPDRWRPNVLAAVRWYASCVDVIQIFGPETAVAYRAPRVADRDCFRPSQTLWSFGGRALWVIRAALILRHPDHPRAPNLLVPPPSILGALPMLLGRQPGYALRMPSLPNGNGGASPENAAKTYVCGPEPHR